MSADDRVAELTQFLWDDGETLLGMLALSAAESLTDPLARDLLFKAKLPPARADALVWALHACDFIVERNREWHIAPAVRAQLVPQLMEQNELSRRVHERLLALTDEDAAAAFDDELPRYLTHGAGHAYHATFLSAAGVREYARLTDQPLSGQLWLADRLAREQVDYGLIRDDAIEVLFLRGMLRYREHRISEAEPLLRQVAGSSETRYEVAVAAHLVGRLDGRRRLRRARGEELLRKSLTIGRELGEDFHEAQVLHTLAQLVGRDRDRTAEAEELLYESRAISRELGERFHLAQVLHTLAQLVGRHDAARAEDLLQESLAISRELGEPVQQAQVLHTLGRLLGRDRARADEAEELLQESLTIGEQLNLLNHQAQVLYSLSQVSGISREQARALLERSLALSVEIGDDEGRKTAERALRRRPEWA
jgi:tetratricopeptide (TPR) repeat protein